jgi:hypothetical protein
MPGLLSLFVGLAIWVVLTAKKLWLGGDVFTAHAPWMMMGTLLILAGIQLFSTGLVAELLARTYFESQGQPIYTIEKIVNYPSARPPTAAPARHA